jgi:hypothetical protein
MPPMIVDMQFIEAKSRAAAAVEQRFEAALSARTRLSPLGAFWRSEVGLLNQYIAVWPYASMAERHRVLEEETKLDGWPPDLAELVVRQHARMYQAAPFSPPIGPRKLGRLYEIRRYHYEPGAIPGVIAAWSEIIAERMKHSPFVGAWYSEEGSTHEWIHVWAYESFEARERTREAVARAGIWPVSVVDRRLGREPRAVSLRMENMLAVPARFSPLQ